MWLSSHVQHNIAIHYKTRVKIKETKVQTLKLCPMLRVPAVSKKKKKKIVVAYCKGNKKRQITNKKFTFLQSTCTYHEARSRLNVQKNCRYMYWNHIHKLDNWYIKRMDRLTSNVELGQCPTILFCHHCTA